MKIRIKGNSIRIRLSRTEVDSFGKDGYLEERTEFGNNAFIYALRNTQDAKELSAEFIDGKLTVLVPDRLTKEWTTTEKVGYDNNMDIGDGKQLYLLLEKDFKCIDAAVTEDQSDNFDNPLKVC
jgi:hypothetical protein